MWFAVKDGKSVEMLTSDIEVWLRAARIYVKAVVRCDCPGYPKMESSCLCVRIE